MAKGSQQITAIAPGRANRHGENFTLILKPLERHFSLLDPVFLKPWQGNIQSAFLIAESAENAEKTLPVMPSSCSLIPDTFFSIRLS